MLYNPRGYWAKSNLVAKNCQKLVTKLFSSIYQWYAGIARGSIYNIREARHVPIYWLSP